MRRVKGPPITVTCDCGTRKHVPYGQSWTCEHCGRVWNTAQIPAAEYQGILHDMRRYRFQAMGVAILIAGTFIALGFLVGNRFFLLAPLALAVWFFWYMPQWRRKVRAAARSLPTWHLSPE
jgi:hypothetical protein